MQLESKLPLYREELREWRRSAVQAADCLYYYKKVYVEGLDIQSDEARRGSAFHAATKLYIDTLWARKETSDIEAAEEAFRSAVEITLLPGRLVPETESLFFRFAERFELNLDAYLHSEQILVTKRGNRLFRWQPDLTYVDPRGLVVYDFKTHWVAWTEEQAREEFQARFYLLMAADEWPAQPAYEIRFVFVRLGVQVAVRFTPEELHEIERQIDAALAVIMEADRTKTYPATSGPHCAFCRLDCPINGRQGLMPVRVDTAAHYQALAGEYLALEQRRKLIQKALKTYNAVAGPQEVNGMVFHSWPQTTARYRVDAVLAVCAEHGLAVPELTVSKTELGPLVDKRRYPVIAEELEHAKREKTIYVFRPRKKGSLGDEPEE